MKALIVSNPKASRSAAGTLRRAVAALRAGGLTVEVAPTQQAGQGAGLARAALDGGADLIVVHGGDGTIMEVSSVIAGTGVPLGILPAGTGNRLAGNLGIGWSVAGATAVILARMTRTLDLGRARASGREHFFAVTAGCGYDAEVMRRTSAAHKRILGTAAYWVRGLQLALRLPRATVRIATDSGRFEGPATTVLIANCGEIIPTGRPFAPQVRPDDGVLDIAVIDARRFTDAMRMTWLLARGRAHEAPGITLLRAREVEIQADPPMAAQADGDPFGATPLSAEILPGALTVLAPPARLPVASAS
jgi:diacylglycerol kinase (ATP)